MPCNEWAQWRAFDEQGGKAIGGVRGWGRARASNRACAAPTSAMCCRSAATGAESMPCCGSAAHATLLSLGSAPFGYRAIIRGTAADQAAKKQKK